MAVVDFNFTGSEYAIPTTPYNFFFGAGINTFSVLKGTSNNFVAIWADPTTELNSGKLYVGSQDTFMVVKDNVIDDWYTETRAGRGGEVLESDDVVDINIRG